MTTTAVFEKQIDQYRRMTGEKRLFIALGLREMSCDIAREDIRRTHPEADDAETFLK